MKTQKLKKRPTSENKSDEASKRLHQENNDGENSTDPTLPDPSPSGSNKVISSNASSSSSPSESGDDNEPWNAPINLETEVLNFMPVDPGAGNHMEKLDKYSRHKKLDKLKCIDIDLIHTIEDWDDKQDERLSEILNRIFLASADSLEEIILRNPVGFLPGLVFQVMRKVVKLQLLFYWWGSDATNFTGYLRGGEIFPKGFKFSHLPKLEEVVINLETEGKGPMYYTTFDCWKNNLKSCGIARSVKKIEYYDDCGFLTTRLKTTFPKAIWPEDFKDVLKYPSSESSADDSFEDSDSSS